MKSRVIPAAVALACLTAGAAHAHHSFAVYFDASKSVTITGKVTSFRFSNPHGTVVLDVTDAQGRVREWRAETNAPVVLQRRQALYPPPQRQARRRQPDRDRAVPADGPELMRRVLLLAALLAAPAPVLAEPDHEGFWNLAFDGEPDAALLAKLPPDTVVIEDTGVVEFPEDEYGGLKLKPAALDHAEQWNPAA